MLGKIVSTVSKLIKGKKEEDEEEEEPGGLFDEEENETGINTENFYMTMMSCVQALLAICIILSYVPVLVTLQTLPPTQSVYASLTSVISAMAVQSGNLAISGVLAYKHWRGQRDKRMFEMLSSTSTLTTGLNTISMSLTVAVELPSVDEEEWAVEEGNFTLPCL